jgi:hypothetical protein
MIYEYYYGAMHLIWWIVWFILLSWVFILPLNISGQRFRGNHVRSKIVLPDGEDEAKVKRVLEMSEKPCTISNSIKTKIRLEPLISVVAGYATKL